MKIVYYIIIIILSQSCEPNRSKPSIVKISENKKNNTSRCDNKDVFIGDSINCECALAFFENENLLKNNSYSYLKNSVIDLLNFSLKNDENFSCLENIFIENRLFSREFVAYSNNEISLLIKNNYKTNKSIKLENLYKVIVYFASYMSQSDDYIKNIKFDILNKLTRKSNLSFDDYIDGRGEIIDIESSLDKNFVLSLDKFMSNINETSNNYRIMRLFWAIKVIDMIYPGRREKHKSYTKLIATLIQRSGVPPQEPDDQ